MWKGVWETKNIIAANSFVSDFIENAQGRIWLHFFSNKLNHIFNVRCLLSVEKNKFFNTQSRHWYSDTTRHHVGKERNHVGIVIYFWRLWCIIIQRKRLLIVHNSNKELLLTQVIIETNDSVYLSHTYLMIDELNKSEQVRVFLCCLCKYFNLREIFFPRNKNLHAEKQRTVISC